MKHLVLTLWFVLLMSSSALAGVEYVTEEVCHAMAGCWVDTKTGECPDCVIETRKVVTIVNDPVVEVKMMFAKPYVGDPWHFAGKKIDDGFKDRLKEIKSKHLHSTIDVH